MGKGTIFGIILGFGAILMGFVLEKGNIGALLLLSPAVIVFGGTLGAVMVSFSVKDVISMPKVIAATMKNTSAKLQETMDDILGFATTVKRDGLLSLEKVTAEEGFRESHDPLMSRGLMLLMDGLDNELLKDVLENDLYLFEERKKREIAVFEAAGGFSPTMGIIGTVMGLIQVLGNMESAEELAASIAVAFVATLYGVCFANLLYLPIANKLKLMLKTLRFEKEMIIEGVLSINNVESPIVIREKLAPYLQMIEKKKNVTKETAEILNKKEEQNL